MAATLVDSLAVVAPSLPAALVAPDALIRLGRIAEGLAPIAHGGFEVRLDASGRVDLQQRFGVEGADAGRLREHLGRPGTAPLPPGLDDFLAEWAEPSSPLHGGVKELWLELDQPAAAAPGGGWDGQEVWPVSMFVGLRSDRSSRESYEVTEAVLDILVGRASWQLWRDNVRRCFNCCPDDAFVGHVGVMVGRAAPYLRVNVKRLGLARTDDYLRRVGWPGEHENALDVMAQLAAVVDRIVVCLDVGERVQPRLGFECSVTGQPPQEPRWERFLDRLVANGWCTPGKRDGLLEWPGWTVPGDAPAWPAELVLSGLLEPPDRFTSFERQLSHVKVTHVPGREPEAKGYFGYFHVWSRLDSTAERGAPPANGDPIAAATAYLLDARHPDGWWRDFAGVGEAKAEWEAAFGTGDEWVTAFVGAALGALQGDLAGQAARDAWSRLERRREAAGGWGYNGLAPMDADSTAWGLRLAATIDLDGSLRARLARRVLQDHGRPDGGITTYTETWCPRPGTATLTPPDGSHDGWCRTSHPCVSGAAAAVLGDDGVLDFLRRSQRPDGGWSAYWWADDEYAVALAVDALATSAFGADNARVQAAVRWAVGRVDPDGAVPAALGGGASAFATAWCARILAHGGDTSRDARERAVTWLLEHQLADGSWTPSARMFAPRPDVTDRAPGDAPGLEALDTAGVFTTASVLAALADVG